MLIDTSLLLVEVLIVESKRERTRKLNCLSIQREGKL